MLKAAQRTEVPDLWADLPSELAPILRREMPNLAAQILDEIQHQIPEYARPLDPNYMYAIRRGVEEALGQFVDQIADATAPQGRCAGVHRALGKAEMLEGRSLDSLQAAYRLGARLAWRHTSRIGEQARVPPRTLLLLGEAIFAHIDQLSALSVEGYADAQANAAGTLARRRRRLLELLVSEPQAPQRTVEEAAASAQWRLPSKVTVVALERTSEEEASTNPLSRWKALVDLESAEPHLLIPDDNDEQNIIDWERQLRGWRVVVGPSVPVHQVPDALRWARRLMELSHLHILPEHQVIRCRDHLSSVLMLTDETLSLSIIRKRLAPLAALKSKQRARLRHTLLAWLQTRGGAPEIAQRLQVHPQTVRYRLRQLEELFGAELACPDARFEMELALRAADLLVKGTPLDCPQEQEVPD